MKPASIVVVGSFNVDITAFSQRFPREGETVFGDLLRFGCGGKGFNQAVAAHKAGASVTAIMAVGEDELSRRLFDRMQELNMDTGRILVKKDCPTGCAHIQVSRESGENRIVVIPGANARLTDADVMAQEQCFAGAAVLLTQLETDLLGVMQAMRLAKRHGVRVVLNPAPLQPIPNEIFGLCDVFTPNETEACFYTGLTVTGEETARQAARILHQKGAKQVVITLGKTGALYSDGTECFLQAPAAVKAVDTTGAGDAFNGGLCVALAQGLSPRDAMRFATCVSGVTVTRPGAADAMPTRQEILALLDTLP